ncbi:chaplin [Streptomyces sp. NPDC000987]|uniref:chaplin n=1 Tax=Streptomyces sp. NPDC000987 TaxID=3154374 RepID=UPI0033345FF7
MKKTAAVVAGVVLALGMAAPAFADEDTTGVAAGSSGFLSGNVIQHQVHNDLNVCGNSFGLISLFNAPTGVCVNR